MGFVVEPIHDDDKRDYANHEIQTINKSRLLQIAMIIVFNEK